MEGEALQGGRQLCPDRSRPTDTISATILVRDKQPAELRREEAPL